MPRGRPEPEIIVKPKTTKPKAVEPTIEERIQEAAQRFRSQRSADIERYVTDMLARNYEQILMKELGLERDSFGFGSARLRVDMATDTGRELRSRAQAAAQTTLDKIDFSKVELTEAQVRAVQTAYRNELKEAVVFAARELAAADAQRIASKVLGIELEGVS